MAQNVNIQERPYIREQSDYLGIATTFSVLHPVAQSLIPPPELIKRHVI
jgi:hypothetical protein